MAGMLYSLVALGFVLIFKASGVFNFAQGAMVLFAALAMARFRSGCRSWTASRTCWSPTWRLRAGRPR
jgi:branched-chain amino acid transport system permease protein